MILTPHLIVGAAIGSKFNNIFLIAALSVLTHYLMDTIIHYDYPLIKGLKQEGLKSLPLNLIKALIDLSLGVALGIYFYGKGHSLLPVSVGMFFAILPDGLIFAYYLFEKWIYEISGKNIITKLASRVLSTYNNFHTFMHYPIGKKTSNIVEVHLLAGLASQALIVMVIILFALK